MNRIPVIVAAVAAAGVLAVGPSASARPACGGYETCSRHVTHTTSTGGSPYAEPLAALGGRTLAEYLADHIERRLTRM